jgi:hypothetical protein
MPLFICHDVDNERSVLLKKNAHNQAFLYVGCIIENVPRGGRLKKFRLTAGVYITPEPISLLFYDKKRVFNLLKC